MNTIVSTPAIIASIAHGSNFFDAVRSLLATTIFASQTPSRTREMWALFGCHSLVLVLSVAGVGVRWWRGEAWWFRKDGGVLRPNMAIVTQVLFAIFSAASMIVIPTYTLNAKPSNEAYIFLIVSYVPLGLAFHAVTWSTLFAARTSSSTSSDTSTPKSCLRPWAGHLAILLAFLFVTSTAPATYLLFLQHLEAREIVENMGNIVDHAEVGVGIMGLLALQRPSEQLAATGRETMLLYKIMVGVYLGWIVFWSVVYVPSAIRLLLVLRIRRQRFMRSLISLQNLADLVSYPPTPPPPPHLIIIDPLTQTTIDEKRVEREGETKTKPPSTRGSIANRFRRAIALSSSTSTPPSTVSHSSSTTTSSSSPLPTTPPTGAYFDSPTIRPVNFGSSRLDSMPSTVGSLLLFPLPPSRSFDSKSGAVPALKALSSRLRRSGSSRNSAISVRQSSVDEWEKVSARLMAERIMCEVGLDVPGDTESTLGRSFSLRLGRAIDVGEARSKVRMGELEQILERTGRMMWSIVAQLGVTVLMGGSYATFCILTLTGVIGAQELKEDFARWTGWTFVGPAMVGTIIFLFLSFRRPSLSTPDDPLTQQSMSTLDITMAKQRTHSPARSVHSIILDPPSPRRSSSTYFYPNYLQPVLERRVSQTSQLPSSKGRYEGTGSRGVGVALDAGTERDVEKGAVTSTGQRWIPSVWAKERAEEMLAREKELAAGN